MLDHIYNVSIYYMAAIMSVSGFHALVGPQVSTLSNDLILVKIAKTRFFSCFSFALGNSFLFLQGERFLGVAASLALAIVLAGLYVDFARAEGACNCLGPVGLSDTSIFTMRLFAVGAAGTVIWSVVDEKVAARQWDLPNLYVAAVLFLYFLVNFRKRSQSIDVGLDRNDKKGKDVITWESTQFVGLDRDKHGISLGELVEAHPLMFIVAVTNNCPHCSSLLPDIGLLSHAFRERITVVIVFRGELELTECGSSMVLFDPQRTLYSKLDAIGSPFALLLDTNNFRQIAPAAFGADKVRVLFALALNLIVRNKSTVGSST